MYGDKLLEFIVHGRDEPATETRALPLGQASLTGDTRDMGVYGGPPFLAVIAGEEIPAGFVVTLKHADTKDGTFEVLREYPATADVTKPGGYVLKSPLPFGVKNWLKLEFSEALKVSALLAHDVEKWINGLLV